MYFLELSIYLKVANLSGLLQIIVFAYCTTGIYSIVINISWSVILHLILRDYHRILLEFRLDVAIIFMGLVL